MSIFNTACIICVVILLLTLLYLFGTTYLNREALQGMSLKQKWKELGNDPHIKRVSAMPDTKLLNLDWLLQMYPNKYGDDETSAWFNTQDDSAVIKQLAAEKQQDITPWVQPDTQDIDAGMANWGSTDFDRKIAYLANQDRAHAAEYEEQQAYEKPTDIPSSPPPFKPHAPLPPPPPPCKPGTKGCRPKVVPPPPPWIDPGIGPYIPPSKPPKPPTDTWVTAYITKLASNWSRLSPAQRQVYQQWCTNSDCSAAVESGCFRHGDPNCHGRPGFWDTCEHNAACVKGMWGTLSPSQKKETTALAGKGSHSFPKDLCKDSGLCKKIVHPALPPLEPGPVMPTPTGAPTLPPQGPGPVILNPKNKPPSKPPSTGKSGKSSKGHPLKDKNQQSKTIATELRGRSGGARGHTTYPHITNRTLAANLAGSGYPPPDESGVAFWNMPGPLGGAATAAQYYNPQFLDDYSSVAGTGSYFQPPQNQITAQPQQMQPQIPAPRHPQVEQTEVLPRDNEPDSPQHIPQRADIKPMAHTDDGGAKKVWTGIFGAAAPKKYITK